MSLVEDGGVQVGELIGKRCMSGDDVEIGRVVFLERDRGGVPQWIDVELDEEVRRVRGWPEDRVRLSAGRIASWDGERVRLDLTTDGLGQAWFPVGRETVEEPTF